MIKQEFYDRLCLAGKIARNSAINYVIDELPEDLLYTIRSHGSDRGRQGPPGTIKFIGGRFLRLEELQQLDARRAASLLWVDGKVPAWVNIQVGNYNETHTILSIGFCSTLLPADENKLPPDYKCEPGNRLVPFRIRGPIIPAGWQSLQLNGRFPLLRDAL